MIYQAIISCPSTQTYVCVCAHTYTYTHLHITLLHVCMHASVEIPARLAGSIMEKNAQFAQLEILVNSLMKTQEKHFQICGIYKNTINYLFFFSFALFAVN